MQSEHVTPFLVKNLRWRVVYSVSDGSAQFYFPFPLPFLTLLTIFSTATQYDVESKDPRATPGLKLPVSARITHDDGPPTYEFHEDIITAIIENASQTQG